MTTWINENSGCNYGFQIHQALPFAGQFFGGITAPGGLVQNENAGYDNETDAWTSGTVNPTGAGLHCGSGVSRNAYRMAGSSSATTYTRIHETYIDQTWSTLTDVPTPARKFDWANQAFVSRGATYIVGGTDRAASVGPPADNGFLRDNDSYNPGTGSWTAKESMPAVEGASPDVRCQIGEYNGIAYVFTEDADSEAGVGAKFIRTYDSQADSWGTVDSKAGTRQRSSVFSHGGIIYICGYYDIVLGSEVVANYVSLYDIDGDSFSAGTVMNLPASHATGFAFNGFGFVLAGFNGVSSSADNDLRRYDILADSWSARDSLPGATRSYVHGGAV